MSQQMEQTRVTNNLTESTLWMSGSREDEKRPPHPEWNGKRVRFPHRPEVYLIDRGYRRHIPDIETYNNLFRDETGIEDMDINTIPEDTPLSRDACLARVAGTAPVYLVDRGVKRHILTPSVMDRYHFSWRRVQNVPRTVLDPIPAGPAIG